MKRVVIGAIVLVCCSRVCETHRGAHRSDNKDVTVDVMAHFNGITLYRVNFDGNSIYVADKDGNSIQRTTWTVSHGKYSTDVSVIPAEVHP